MGPSRVFSPLAARAWSAMAIRAAHMRGADAGAAVLPPGQTRRSAQRVVNGDPGVGIGVEGDVGIGAVDRALGDDALLVGRLGLDID